MRIEILYFGELRETVSTTRETIALTSSHTTVAGLIDYLSQRGEPWQSALTSSEPLRIAVNQEMGDEQSKLSDGAEVAFFRPVTGG